jgi:hypothetical protein
MRVPANALQPVFQQDPSIDRNAHGARR